MFEKRWCKYKKMFSGMSLRRLVSARFNNKILANKDEIHKDKAESYLISGFVILASHLPSFLVWVFPNVMLVGT